MTRHAHLLTLVITDKGSAFVSKVMYEVSEIQGITFRHGTKNHAQTIGLLAKKRIPQ